MEVMTTLQSAATPIEVHLPNAGDSQPVTGRSVEKGRGNASRGFCSERSLAAAVQSGGGGQTCHEAPATPRRKQPAPPP